MGRKVLITGGVRSGKSRFALDLALAYPPPRVFLATAEPIDPEMQSRILRHQVERKDQFLTIEEPINPAEKILGIDFPPSVIVIDCLTLWLGNLYHRFGENIPAIQKRVDQFIGVVTLDRRDWILVTNEVGLGVIPTGAFGRRFVDRLGELNQKLARLCDEVVLMSCGLPQFIKGSVGHAKMVDPSPAL